MSVVGRPHRPESLETHQDWEGYPTQMLLGKGGLMQVERP